MSDATHWYFAYGSNMSPAIFVDRRKMTPREALCARLDGHRLAFDLPIGPGERAVANVRVDPDAHVFGVAYRIDDEELARLDLTEGVHRGLYARVPVVVTALDGTSIHATTYRSTRGVPGRKPSRRYLDLLLDGARHHGLPEDYVRTLAAWPLAIDEREVASGAAVE